MSTQTALKLVGQNAQSEAAVPSQSSQSSQPAQPARAPQVVQTNESIQSLLGGQTSASPPHASISSAGPSPSQIDMKYLVKALIKYSASDLHIKAGRPPLYRINGKLVPAKMPEFTPEQAQAIIYSILTSRQIKELEEDRQLDLSFGSKGLGRFRCNVYFQQGTLSAAIRMIPLSIPKLEDLGLPEVLKEMCYRPRGLILVTGPTGSGKSTTLASMLQYINENRHVHILAIEDPIEFVHRDNKASITQREVGSDTHSLQDALFSGLRQDPDIIMISEMRNFEMIQTALTAAETGHLVMSTLHTNDAKGTIDRILDVFPSEARQQVRIQLSSALVGIVSQQLLLRSDNAGRVAACEILIKSPTIESHILRNELEKIPEAIENSGDYYKMQSMNRALERLIQSKSISLEEAMKCSGNPSDLKLRVSGLASEKAFEMDEGDVIETSERPERAQSRKK